MAERWGVVRVHGPPRPGATKVSGRPELITAIATHPDLKTIGKRRSARSERRHQLLSGRSRRWRRRGKRRRGGGGPWRRGRHGPAAAAPTAAPEPATTVAHRPRARRHRRAGGRVSHPSPRSLDGPGAWLEPRRLLEQKSALMATRIDADRVNGSRNESTATAVWDSLCRSIPMMNMWWSRSSWVRSSDGRT